MNRLKTLAILTALQLINSLPATVQAQKLSGIVYDAVNHIPIAQATVFFEASSLYALTNGEGYFELAAIDSINVPLVISHVSYQKQIIRPPYTLPDTIKLQEKSLFIGEILVEAGKYSRKQKMETFKRQFLGDSRAGKSCTIENEDDIILSYDSRENRLTAACRYPVIIKNSYLGYKIHLSLNQFEIRFSDASLAPKSAVWVYYEGSSFFEDIARPNDQTVKARRDYIYKGSSAHFLKALSLNRLASSGYNLLKAESMTQTAPSDAFTLSDSLHFAKVKLTVAMQENAGRPYYGKEYVAKLHVVYNYAKKSDVYFFRDEFLVDAYGNMAQPDNLLFTGFMGEQRTGEALPVFYE
ncbi:MAG: carboxypeptidase-like regulatory domain-containing protein [Tannerellaceae bacterium]|nr:carboxypeptidase-like regulatory domain-containing protein [Tannerellaceae bacterium]